MVAVQEKIRNYITYLLIFVIVWVGLDFVFSLLRVVTFVLAKAVKTALYSGVISLIIFEIMHSGNGNKPKY